MLPKRKERKTKAAAAKGSRARQQKRGHWIRADRERPWVREPRGETTEEIEIDPSTRSAPQVVEPIPRGTSVGSWPLRSRNENADTETIRFPLPLFKDRMDIRRRVRALEEAAERICGTLDGPAGLARGASTESSSSGPTQTSISTFETTLSGPKVAGVPTTFENPYLSSSQDGKKHEPSTNRQVQSSSAAQNPNIMYVAGRPVSPVSQLSVVISLSGLSDVSGFTDVDLH